VKKQMITGTIVLSLVFSLLPSPILMAENDSSDFYKTKEAIKQRDKQIQQLEKKKRLTEQDQKEVFAHIRELQGQVNSYDQTVYQLERKLVEGQNRIEQLEQDMERYQQRLSQRFRRLYQQGQMVYIETLLQSQSLKDFLVRLHMLSILTDSDARLMENVQRNGQKLLKEQKKLSTTLHHYTTKKEKAKRLYRKLEVQLENHQSELVSLNEDIDQLEMENEDAQRELHDLVGEATDRVEEEEKQLPIERELPSYEGGKMIWPVNDGILTSRFGQRWHPIKKRYRLHAGIDIAAKLGTPIQAAASGEVIESRPSRGYGYILVIYHGDGLTTLYAHMYGQTVKVKRGERVERGQVIAKVGNNGWSTGPHLHFEVHKNRSVVNPLNYF
jgi:murein DD-endopeptidase MepM/ murein hydrolase activator NlpD